MVEVDHGGVIMELPKPGVGQRECRVCPQGEEQRKRKAIAEIGKVRVNDESGSRGRVDWGCFFETPYQSAPFQVA